MPGTADNQNILNAIYTAIDGVNEILPIKDRIAKEPYVLLMGEAGSLDSLGLVTLLVGVEQSLQHECGMTYNLSADPDLYDSENQILSTPMSLATFLQKALKSAR